MSGGAYAASHYLITSTKQISPKVLKSLTGKAGPAGPAGPAGAAGAGTAGAAGPQGPAGTNGSNGVKGETGKEGPEGKQGEKGDPGESGFTETLPAGKTETGTWNISATKESYATTSISFAIPLAHALGENEVHYVDEAGAEEAKFNTTTSEWEKKPTSKCPGTLEKPAALPGNLCVYEGTPGGSEVERVGGIDEMFIKPLTPAGPELAETGAFESGAWLDLRTEETELDQSYGTWAVTAG